MGEKEDTVLVKEFVTGDAAKNIRKKASQAKKNYAKRNGGGFDLITDNKPIAALLIYVAISIAVILVCTLVCKVSIVPVGVILIIETLLAVCLHNLQVWIHGIVAIAEIIVGVMTGQLVFVLLCTALYVAAVVALMFIMDQPE